MLVALAGHSFLSGLSGLNLFAVALGHDRIRAQMAQPPRVFISYARSDGLAFARGLRGWLEGKHVPLFQDLVSLVGGDDFPPQIYKAIDQVEFLVLLMTPNALKSEAIRKEWRYARQRDKCVYPVVVPKIEVNCHRRKPLVRPVRLEEV